MTRSTGVILGAIAVALAGVWLALGPSMKALPTTPRSSTHVVGGSLEDLLMDADLIPIDGEAPKAFALESLDGRRVTLADLAGRPALLYFWATW
jgi:cytochrome oxidase Cu insertion factor (SCO1/SenC/PrrC family)